MSETLRAQVKAIIETCTAALNAKTAPPLDHGTGQIVQAILAQAKKEAPNDEVLAAVDLSAIANWAALLAAMNTIKASLPLPKQQAGGPPPKVGTFT